MATLENQVSAINSELEEAYENDELLNWLENQLAIDYLVSDQLEYKGAVLTVTIGGPTIEVDTFNNSIKAHYGEAEVSGYMSFEVCDELNETLKQLYEVARQ